MDRSVEVNGKKMNIYISGRGKNCLVFLSGSGVPFPKLEYKPLVNELALYNEVIIIEKFGYGFSDMTEETRNINTVIEEYRCALQQLDIVTPVVLVAHSMGFIETLRWSQLYPAEICGLIGVDPATPECYKDFDIEKALEALMSISKVGSMREEHVRTALAQLHEEFKFSDKELREYKEMLNRNLANKVCINEAENLRSNIALVESSNTVQIPTLFLISNGEGTTQKSEVWRNNALNYLKKIKIAEYKLFDYPHNLYKFASKEMAKAVCEFLQKHIG